MRYPKEAIVFRANDKCNDYWNGCTVQPLDVTLGAFGIHIWNVDKGHSGWSCDFETLTRLTPAAREFLKAAKAGR